MLMSKSSAWPFYTDVPEVPVTPGTAQAIRDAAQAVADAGAAVEEFRPKCLDSIRDQIRTLYAGVGGERLRRTLANVGTAKPHRLLQQAIEYQRTHRPSIIDLAEILVWVDEFRSQMLSFLTDYDAVLCPAHAHASIGHGLSNSPEYKDGPIYCMIYNFTGGPGAVVRSGTSADGLPIGVQIAARPWREEVTLALARRIEQALGGWQRPPL